MEEMLRNSELLVQRTSEALSAIRSDLNLNFKDSDPNHEESLKQNFEQIPSRFSDTKRVPSLEDIELKLATYRKTKENSFSSEESFGSLKVEISSKQRQTSEFDSKPAKEQKSKSRTSDLKNELKQTRELVEKGFQTAREVNKKLDQKLGAREVRKTKSDFEIVSTYRSRKREGVEDLDLKCVVTPHSTINATPKIKPKKNRRSKKSQNTAVIFVSEKDLKVTKNKLMLQQLPSLHIKGGLSCQKIPYVEIPPPGAVVKLEPRQNAILKDVSHNEPSPKTETRNLEPENFKCCKCQEKTLFFHQNDFDTLLERCDFNVFDPRIEEYASKVSHFESHSHQEKKSVESEKLSKPETEGIQEVMKTVKTQFVEEENKLESLCFKRENPFLNLLSEVEWSKRILSAPLTQRNHLTQTSPLVIAIASEKDSVSLNETYKVDSREHSGKEKVRDRTNKRTYNFQTMGDFTSQAESTNKALGNTSEQLEDRFFNMNINQQPRNDPVFHLKNLSTASSSTDVNYDPEIWEDQKQTKNTSETGSKYEYESDFEEESASSRKSGKTNLSAILEVDTPRVETNRQEQKSSESDITIYSSPNSEQSSKELEEDVAPPSNNERSKPEERGVKDEREKEQKGLVKEEKEKLLKNLAEKRSDEMCLKVPETEKLQLIPLSNDLSEKFKIDLDIQLKSSNTWNSVKNRDLQNSNLSKEIRTVHSDGESIKNNMIDRSSLSKFAKLNRSISAFDNMKTNCSDLVLSDKEKLMTQNRCVVECKESKEQVSILKEILKTSELHFSKTEALMEKLTQSLEKPVEEKPVNETVRNKHANQKSVLRNDIKLQPWEIYGEPKCRVSNMLKCLKKPTKNNLEITIQTLNKTLKAPVGEECYASPTNEKNPISEMPNQRSFSSESDVVEVWNQNSVSRFFGELKQLKEDDRIEAPKGTQKESESEGEVVVGDGILRKRHGKNMLFTKATSSSGPSLGEVSTDFRSENSSFSQS